MSTPGLHGKAYRRKGITPKPQFCPFSGQVRLAQVRICPVLSRKWRAIVSVIRFAAAFGLCAGFLFFGAAVKN
ncbi:MAG: hypothetical protein J6K66_03505 [Clostridia bacterium]|nr:hypothetical protein [Clostridia bacterium]